MPIITVCKYPAPIEWAFTMNKQKSFFQKQKKQNIPSQKLKTRIMMLEYYRFLALLI